jgi:hypothetical protein
MNRRIASASVVRSLALLVALGLDAPTFAEPPGRKLKGDELLIEFVSTGSGSNRPPGIYAVTADGECVLVITHGHSPEWSPDHQRFAFTKVDRDLGMALDARELFVYETASGRITPVPGRTETLCGPPSLEPPGTYYGVHLMWHPGGGAIIAWRPWNYLPRLYPLVETDTSGAIGHAVMPAPTDPFHAYLGIGIDPPTVWAVPEDVRFVVGRLSIRPDGLTLYERAQWFVRSSDHPPVGLAIFDAHAGRIAPFRPASVHPEAVLLNPAWSPTGTHAAFDVVLPDGTRECWVADMKAAGYPAARIDAFAKLGERERGSSFAAWSPDGKALAVTQRVGQWPYAQLGGRSAVWWLSEADAPMGHQACLLIGRNAGGLRTCFSPDATRVAVLSADAIASDSSVTGETEVTVHRIAGRYEAFHVFPGTKTAAVTISW